VEKGSREDLTVREEARRGSFQRKLELAGHKRSRLQLGGKGWKAKGKGLTVNRGILKGGGPLDS